MANTHKRIYQGQLSTAETTLATVPSSKSWIVKEIIVANTTSTAINLSLSVVPSGGVAGATNRIVGTKSVAGNEVVIFALSSVMNTSDFLSGLASATGLTVTVSGVEVG